MTSLVASESYQIFRKIFFLWKFDERCWDDGCDGTSARVPTQVSINFGQQVALGRTAHLNPMADFMIPASLPQQEHYFPNSPPCITCPVIGASQAHPGAGCPSADCCIPRKFIYASCTGLVHWYHIKFLFTNPSIQVRKTETRQNQNQRQNQGRK